MKTSRFVSTALVLTALLFASAYSSVLQKGKNDKKSATTKAKSVTIESKSKRQSSTSVPPSQEAVFQLLSEDVTGVKFNNLVPPSKALKESSKLFTIASGGVAVGDVNGDGLPDIYLTRFMAENKLFINKGNFKFEEAPESAGVSDSAACSFGATMVDIEGDGDLDIYVSEYNFTPNRFFINNGDGTFTDKAKEFGVDFVGNSIQSTFFDYDNDGDLDIYLVVNGISRSSFKSPGEPSKLYQNNGNNKFTDVAEKAGLVQRGFGLSASIADYNNDGWLDIYVANDFEEPDHLYINQQNGTFKDETKKATKHTSYYSMGSDAADINNDGYIDFMTVDMLPDNHKRRNTQFDNLSIFSSNYDSLQMVKNTLQLNQGDCTFSDIAYSAGVAQTDWSWTTLLCDFNNDGFKDIIVTNGLKYDIMDRDAIRFAASPDVLRKMGLEEMAKIMEDSTRRLKPDDIDLDPYLRRLPRTRVPNFLFRNSGNIEFQRVTNEWGFDIPFNTVAAAYADFDNDGDLDLVLNNIDTMATIYKNMSREHGLGNYLQVKLAGKGLNAEGLGAKIQVRSGDVNQTIEVARVHGFASSSDVLVNFGVGKSKQIDEVMVTWRSGQKQTLKNVKVNQKITVKEEDALVQKVEKPEVISTILMEVSPDTSLNFTHIENLYDDFFQDRLLPNRLSINGPGMAVGDVNGDGLEDVFIGGPQEISSSLFLQQPSGRFVLSPQKTITTDSMYEDLGVILFDVDEDRDLDIYVASGGNEGSIEEPQLLQDRLYINDGKGNFTKGQLPFMFTSTSCVVAGDFDNDGDLDLFVGGRNVPGKYPEIPRSYLLMNDHGTFVDVTDQLGHDFLNVGMVTSALWTDYNNDGNLDLIIVGEWMTPHIYQNIGSNFREVTQGSGVDTMFGWWNSINGGDFDNDGDIDYVLGNLGVNTRYKATDKYPIELYSHDFDDNGSIDHVMTYFYEGKKYPLRVFLAMYNAFPTLNKKFPVYADFAVAEFQAIFSKEKIDSANHLKANYFQSCYVENLGNGKFSANILPEVAQISPVFGTSIQDFNGDGNVDILSVGNFFGPDREAWRYDASQGVLYLGDGKGEFKPLSKSESGFFDMKDARSLITVSSAKNDGMYIMTGNNSSQLQVFKKSPTVKTTEIKVDRKDGFTYAVVTLKNGQSYRQEFYNGAGYLSQSSLNMVVSSEVKSISFYKGNVVKKTINLSYK